MPKRTDKTSVDEVPVPSQSPPKRNRTKKSKNTLSAGDTDAVSDFCAQVQIEESEFNDWSASHRELDLSVQIYISPREAVQGGVVQVNFSRTIISTTSEGKPMTSREKVTHQLEIPNSLNEGARFAVPGQGDREGSRCGDLHVIVKIRRTF